MGINSSTTDESYMRLAMVQAQLAAQAGEVPVGAVVVLGDQVIAEAHNQVITQNNPAAHAEVLALKKAGDQIGNYRLIDCELFVTLEPCMMCAGACVHGRIKRLIYGAADPKTGAVASVDQLLIKSYHNHLVNVTGGVLQAQCGQILTDFFAAKRAQHRASKQ